MYHKISLQKLLAYRRSAVSKLLTLLIWPFLDLFFFKSIFNKIESINGWSYWDTVMLTFRLSLFWDIFWRITSGGLPDIPEKIHDGNITRYFLQSFNSLTHLAFSNVGLGDSNINALVIGGYYFLNNAFDFSMYQVFMYFVMLFVGVGIFSAVITITNALGFWMTDVSHLSNLYWELLNIGRYPKDIFDGFWANLFMYVFPIFFMVNMPVDILRNGVDLKYVLLGFVLLVVFGGIAMVVWRVGERRYEGVSV